jgi:hypothetical protein
MDFRYKYRFNRERTFGVEIECVINHDSSREQVWSRLEATCGVQVSDYGHHVTTRNPHGAWVMKTDGSIRGAEGRCIQDWQNLEIVSPILKGEEGLQELRNVVAELKTMVTVNRSCGLHIHHGARDMTDIQMETLYRLWEKNQDVVNYFTTPSRRANHYCEYLRSARPACYMTTARNRGWSFCDTVARTENRYRALNFASMNVRGTLEFRQHHATLDIEKMVAWIIFTQACIEFGVHNAGHSITPSDKFDPLKTHPARHLLWRVGMQKESEDEIVAAAYRRLRGCWDKLHTASVVPVDTTGPRPTEEALALVADATMELRRA